MDFKDKGKPLKKARNGHRVSGGGGGKKGRRQ